jgi:CBS domain-containing protein
MSKLAKDVMTSHPQCCTAETTLDEVANLMVENNCGEIPVVDAERKLIGVVTDRDIVCRIVAKRKDPSACTASECMTAPVISATEEMPIDDVLDAMEAHQIRRMPVVDENGRCCGIVAQADIALAADEAEVGELVREVSRDAIHT